MELKYWFDPWQNLRQAGQQQPWHTFFSSLYAGSLVSCSSSLYRSLSTGQHEHAAAHQPAAPARALGDPAETVIVAAIACEAVTIVDAAKARVHDFNSLDGHRFHAV